MKKALKQKKKKYPDCFEYLHIFYGICFGLAILTTSYLDVCDIVCLFRKTNRRKETENDRTEIIT